MKIYMSFYLYLCVCACVCVCVCTRACVCVLHTIYFYLHTIPQGVAIFVFHVVRHEKNWGKLKRLFTSKIGKKRQDTHTTNKSGAMSVCRKK